MNNLDDLNRKVLQLVKAGHLDKESAITLLKKLNPTTGSDDIAIIGVACKFPGADSVDEFWQNTKHGLVKVGQYPQTRRKDADKLLPPNMPDPYFTGGFLEEVDKFDAGFFNISPDEAASMDPHQRLFLETAFEAVEEAGYSGKRIQGSQTGVYVGIDHTSKMMYSYLNSVPRRDYHTMMGNWASIMASRVSYAFNLQGPSMVIDSGCSSGLVAVHTACKALKNKDCETAIVGGISLFLLPISPGQLLDSDDQVTRVFDRNPGGTNWGEAVAAVMLKPLRTALQDNDHIHAVIKGSAINNNGATAKLAELSADGLRRVVLKAWEDAKINPETLSYVETHGNATLMGDSMEVTGLNAAFKSLTEKKQFSALGSAKGTIGHLLAGSGMASLLKIISALKHKQLPPSANFEAPNPFIPFHTSALYVNDKLQEWEAPADHPRRAGINSYGFSGTNCHLILEEAPQKDKGAAAASGLHVLALSAKSASALHKLVADYAAYLQEHPEQDLADICYTANTGRGHYTHRLAIIAATSAELIEQLATLAENGLAGQGERVFYNVHAVASSRSARGEGELLEGEKKQLSLKAGRELANLRTAPNDEGQLASVCSLYVQGADADWELLYAGQTRSKLSLPVYPLERTRYWLEQLLPTQQTEGVTQHDH